MIMKRAIFSGGHFAVRLWNLKFPVSWEFTGKFSVFTGGVPCVCREAAGYTMCDMLKAGNLQGIPVSGEYQNCP